MLQYLVPRTYDTRITSRTTGTGVVRTRIVPGTSIKLRVSVALLVRSDNSTGTLAM